MLYAKVIGVKKLNTFLKIKRYLLLINTLKDIKNTIRFFDFLFSNLSSGLMT